MANKKPRRVKIDPEEIFEYLRKHENITEEEEDEMMAEMIVEEAEKEEQAQERKNVFMGKARSMRKNNRKRK